MAMQERGGSTFDYLPILQKRCHVNWKQKGSLILDQVFGVNQETPVYDVGILLTEDIKRFVSFVPRGLDLNRIQFGTSRKQEVYFIVGYANVFGKNIRKYGNVFAKNIRKYANISGQAPSASHYQTIQVAADEVACHYAHIK